MADRALAHIEKISWIKPIEGADNIELIGVLGWVCIAKIGEFHVGDKCVYIEIDSLVNEKDDRFAFLANKHFKIKSMKLGKFNVISQGLAMPITLFPEIIDKAIGSDVTKELNVTYYSIEDRQRKSNGNTDTKYKKMKARHPKLFQNKLVKRIMKTKFGKEFFFLILGRKADKPKDFPTFVVKTDEFRCENYPQILEDDRVWVVTEKIDGTSTTFFLDLSGRKPDFGVCSRNIRQLDINQKNYHSEDIGDNVYWEMAIKYDVENVLKDIANKNNLTRVVLQGETYGEKLQGNPYKMTYRDFAAFNLIFDGNRLGSVAAKDILAEYKIPFVPIVNTNYHTPETMEELKLQADGYSIINSKVRREGFVYRSVDGKDSFKNVSRKYLLTKGE